MRHSRSQPSPRYLELQALYRTMHEEGEKFLGVPPEKTFSGSSLAPHVAAIKQLIERTGAVSVLDYGSGKGQQYEPRFVWDGSGARWPSVIDYWGVDEVICYDPCYGPYSELPREQFDGVVCTNVLEQCPEDDLPWIVREVFDYATRFVFASIACYPARKRLPNGDNMHSIVKPAEWWKSRFEEAAAARGDLLWEAWFQASPDGPYAEKHSNAADARGM
jgi:hypothetical protein